MKRCACRGRSWTFPDSEGKDDAEKHGGTKRRVPVDGACSMNDDVRKQSNSDGNNQGYRKHGYKINE
jgi:hypothetical protein